MGVIVSGVTMTSGWFGDLIPFLPSTLAEVSACLGGLLSLVIIYIKIAKYIAWKKESVERLRILKARVK